MTTTEQLEHKLNRWLEASVIDVDTAERIRKFEAVEPAAMRWPVVLAIAFGAIMVAAGVLLFVAAHWEELSPAQRFGLVLLMVAGFHLVGGALMERSRALGIALHGVGTAALGGGIFLAGQIFNLEEHWPGGVMLWAIGAAIGWLLLNDWVQASLVMVLGPAWLASEWGVRYEREAGSERYLVVFLAVLALVYLGARRGPEDSTFRKSLAWIGGIALLPMAFLLALVGHEWSFRHEVYLSPAGHFTGVLIAFVLPLAVAWLLRRSAALWNVAFALWALAVALLDYGDVMQNVLQYFLFALGSIGLVTWGLREHRRERINLGVAGFALTIIAFYFSTMVDKLGRSASLVAFGLIFLLGGWKLEQLRRKLVAKTEGGAR